MTTTTNKTDKPDELGALAAQAETLGADAAADAAAAAGGDEQPQAAPPSNAQLLAGTFQLAREVVCIIGEVRSPRMVLDDATTEQLGAAWGAVADKRGWDLGRLMGDYAAEVAAIMMTLTIGAKLSKAVRAEIDARAPVEDAQAVGAVSEG